MWIVIAILFILFMCLYPYGARAISRRRMLRQLCTQIRRAGGKVRFLCRFPSLTRNCTKSPELLVRAGNVQYVVKLWTPWYRDANLCIDADGCAYETRTVGAPLTPRAKRRPRPLRGLRYTVPSTKMRFRVPHAMQQMSVLLIAPSYRRILRREGGKWCELNMGDTLFEKILSTPADFLSLVCRAKADENA